MHLGEIWAIDTLSGFQKKSGKNSLTEIFLDAIAKQNEAEIEYQ